MAISKERLEQLKKEHAIIYGSRGWDYKKYKLHENWLPNQVECWDVDGTHHPHTTPILEDLFETLAEAQWHADKDAERTEYFCPPMELEYDKEYKFNTHNGEGIITAGINEYDKIRVAEYSRDWIISCKLFDTYPEAVAYARKLFEGNENHVS